MLSAGADRFGFWGANSAWRNWTNFEKYTRTPTPFLQDMLSQFTAYSATFLITNQNEYSLSLDEINKI